MATEYKPAMRLAYGILIAIVLLAYKFHKEIWGVALVLDRTTYIVLLMIIAFIFLPPLIQKLKFGIKKCVVCGAETHDRYLDEINMRTPLCRRHLVERWKKEFLFSTVNMVVIEPDFEIYPDAYLYAPSKRLVKEWNYEKSDAENVDRILSFIPGRACASCRKPASVAWIGKDDYIWPFFSKITAQPTFYCKQCAASKIEPLVLSSKNDFGEGVYAPGSEAGVYHVQEF